MFIKRWLGFVLILLGIILFFVNPALNITGYSIADNFIIKGVWFYVIGLGFILYLGSRENPCSCWFGGYC